MAGGERASSAGRCGVGLEQGGVDFRHEPTGAGRQANVLAVYRERRQRVETTGFPAARYSSAFSGSIERVWSFAQHLDDVQLAVTIHVDHLRITGVMSQVESAVTSVRLVPPSLR